MNSRISFITCHDRASPFADMQQRPLAPKQILYVHELILYFRVKRVPDDVFESKRPEDPGTSPLDLSSRPLDKRFPEGADRE